MIKFSSMSPEQASVVSPCVRNCCLDHDNICLGCFRSIDEITGWAEADEQIRRNVLENADSRRKACQFR